MKPSTETKLYFYQNGKLMTVRESLNTRTVFRAWLCPLAEKNTDSTSPTALLHTDEHNSALGISAHEHLEHHAYLPYGHTSTSSSSRALTKFNGEHLELTTQYYLLGNGYRAFSPSLMRFYSPDSWSPFGAGGINAYMYCGGDPVNHTDSSGHMRSAKHKTRTRIESPPSFEQATANESLALTTKKTAQAAREMSKTIPTDDPINGPCPPHYEARASSGQFTLDITLNGRDTTSRLTRAKYEAELKSISKRLDDRGINSDGLPVRQGNTDIMFEQNSNFNKLILDAVALDVRRQRTAYWERVMEAQQKQQLPE